MDQRTDPSVTGELSPNVWHFAQLGRVEVAYQLRRINHHLKVFAAVRTAFDPAERDKALAALHERSVDEAAFLYVAHDVGPRAMSPKIKNFVQPKSWFVDFSTMTIN